MCSCPLWKYTRKSVNTEPTNDRRQLRYIAANVLLNCWQCNDSVMRVVEMWTMTRTHLLTVQWDTAHYRQCIMRSTTTTTTSTTILQSGNFCSRNHCSLLFLFCNFLTYLSSCALSLYQCIMDHRPLLSILVCFILPLPSSSSRTWSLLLTFLSSDLLSHYYKFVS